MILNQMEIDCLSTYGYAVLAAPRLAELGLDTRGLRMEVSACLAQAYPDASAAEKLMLPLMSGQRSPISCSWALNGALPQIAEEYLGSTPVLKPAKATRFGQATMWHRDSYLPTIRGIKVGIYLEPEPVDFDVVPASHLARHGDYVSRCFGMVGSKRPSAAQRNPARTLPTTVPLTRLLLEPQSILIFDLGLWHANLSSEPRLQWSVSYLDSAGEMDDLVDYLAEFGEYDRRYPVRDYPYFPSPWATADASPLASRTWPVMVRTQARGVR